MKQRVLRLAIPAALKHLLDIIQILIDMLMVGVLGVAALAAVGLSMQFMMVIQAMMSVYAIGSSALISRYIGSGRHHRASAVVFVGLWVALAGSLIIGVIGWSFASDFFRWMGSSDDVIKLGSGYFEILSLGMGLIFLDTLAYSALSASGDTRSSLFIKIASAFLNAGLKGMAAYAEHAANLGYNNEEVFAFISKALSETTRTDITLAELIPLVMETGKYGVDVMALLDKANTESYGNPEITEVNIGTRGNPAILISGHDLKDMEELLAQTEGTGVDVYTHSEMLPANYYPKFKKYKHFVGNYGNAWWKQKEEFESFNGPILFTTNCLVPPTESYKDRVYTTGATGFAGVKHIADREPGKQKDFSAIIEHAKKCAAPTQIEEGKIVGGFAHEQVFQLADKVVDAVKSGAIRKFFVMAGCDGRMKSRDYYTEFADKLPKDTVILTAGCAKYRYNKLPLGDIGGIPRVLDAGQCNDSYSLALIALKLKEVFELNDINELPIAYNIAWYEQKAVIVLLALLYLGVKNIHLGPTLPAFLSPAIVEFLVNEFGINVRGEVDADLAKFLA